MIKCFIFDRDGTLLDTIGTITYYVNKVIIDEGLSPITEEECKYFAGNGAETVYSASGAFAPKLRSPVLLRKTVSIYCTQG